MAALLAYGEDLDQSSPAALQSATQMLSALAAQQQQLELTEQVWRHWIGMTSLNSYGVTEQVGHH